MSRPTDGPIRVCVAGAAGKMGRLTVQKLAAADGVVVVSAVDKQEEGRNLRDLLGQNAPEVAITSRLGETLDAVECHVLVDFTTAGVGAAHAMSALQRGVAPVIGTSGISDRDTREIAEASRSSGTPAMIVPNFAVGATLMLQFAKVAAKWMPHVEIIEMHHDEKADAPSGTAKRTAEVIDEVRGDPPRARVREQVKVEGVRGGKIDNIPVHSVRLRGLVAHQLVMFGNDGEVLTLRHDSFGRDSFMAGVELAVRHVWDLQGLTVGLDVLMR